MSRYCPHCVSELRGLRLFCPECRRSVAGWPHVAAAAAVVAGALLYLLKIV